MVVTITGASAGIGRAIANAFARRGASVALLARGEDGLHETQREIQAAGGKVLSIATDMADVEQVNAAAQAIEKTLGPINIWVNNAMVSVVSPCVEITPEEYRRVTDVTYLGYVWGTLAALKYMRPRNHGTIIQVGSALSYRSIPLQAPYCAAKSAIRGFTDSLRSELLHDGSAVRVTLVLLSAFNTPQFDWVRSHMPRQARALSPMFQPEVAARAIVWAATHKRRELIVGFPAWRVILANKFIPGLLDHWLAKNGYEKQQTLEPLEPNHPDNLFQPQTNYRMHGRFDNEARSTSGQLWLTMHRNWVLAGLVLAALLL